MLIVCMNTRLKPVIMVLLLFHLAHAESKQQRAEELLKRATQGSSLDPSWGEPYRIQYRFRVTAFGAVDAPGTYLRIWGGPGRVRQEISVPGFSETIVLNGNRKWTLRNTVAEPNVLIWLMRGLQPNPRWGSGEVAHAIRAEKHGAQSFQCLDWGPKNGGWRTFCFDDATGALTAMTDLGTRFEYSEWQQINSRLAPRRVKMLGDEHQEVDAELVSLEPHSSDESTFSEPPGAQEWTHCEHQSMPVVTRDPWPDFGPWGPKQYSVEVYGVIETDGRVDNVAIVSSSDKELEKPALAAFSRWRFRPATCERVPIRTETRTAFRTTNFR